MYDTYSMHALRFWLHDIIRSPLHYCGDARGLVGVSYGLSLAIAVEPEHNISRFDHLPRKHARMREHGAVMPWAWYQNSVFGYSIAQRTAG